MKHTLAILVENKPGVLTRVAGLFSRRGFNIESLAVGITENKDISRITILVSGDDNVLEQVQKQLNKLIDVIRVSDIPAEESVNRELALIKVGVDSTTRAEVMQIVNIFRAKIVDVGIKSLVIEVTGDESKINAIEQLLRQFGIKEMVRTGKIAMNRGAKVVQSEKR
ncbi:MAG: acetolactate synthase small subunit [Candidatus Methanoperedens sp.]|nr:acetolactate synthase small subunit [Candidatus Methanoperedens sp.]CAG1004577.1 acetolactate synthase I/III small subunit [Methanosarcinales archaeon]